MNAPTHSRVAWAPAALCLALLSACAPLGPVSINRDRFDYGAAVADSWKQQALLNIVKMRYADNPVFVDVASIVAGYSMQTTVSGGLGYNLGIHGPNSWNLGAQGQFTDRPTITYVPQTGQQFLRGLLTPIAPASVLFLIQSGYAADFVLGMTVESINGLNNRSAAPARTPGDAEFFEAVELIRKVQRSGNIGMRVELDKGKKEATLLTFPRRQSSPELKAQTAEIGRLLGLEPNAAEYKVSFGMAAGGGTDIDMATRSLVQIMVELADTVEVPQVHLDERSAYPALPPTPGVKPLMRVASGSEQPADAFAVVMYRGHWFWSNAAAVIYQPQVESWDGNQIQLRAAVSIKPSGAQEPSFGAVFVNACTEVDRVARTVTFNDLVITKSNFPPLPDQGAA